MDGMHRVGKDSSDGAPGPSRSTHKKKGKGQAGPEAKTTVRLLVGSSPSESARQVDSSHGVVEESSEDDHNPEAYRRGHNYRNVKAQDNSRIQLGDNTYGNNTYIAKQIVYSEQQRRSGGGEEAKEINILEALAFEHMRTRLASISAAQDRTCRWLFDTSEYVQWRQGFSCSEYRFLWIKGKPGSGKSTLMATAVQQASCDFKNSIVASFFFNARGDGLGRTTEGMYRSLLHQIFSQLRELPSGIPSRVSSSLKRRGWGLPMLQNMLRRTILQLGHSRGLVCYVDALDECAEADIRDAVQYLEELRNLAKSRNIKFLICFASRHYPTITIQYHRAIKLEERPEHDQDISRYVKSTLHVPGAIGVELHDSLLDRWGHVFLWVVLTVKSLNELYDRGGKNSQLRLRISDTSDKVEDVFRGLLQHKDEYLLPILQWVLFAQRALDVKELYFAVMTSTGQLSTGVQDSAEIDPARMQMFLTASSRGLVEFWSGERQEWSSVHSVGYRRSVVVIYAQLIHESLREYLFKTGLLELDPSMERRVEAISHARLSQWCVDYVATDSELYISEAFSKIESIRKLPFLDYVLEMIEHHFARALAGNALPKSTLEQFANLWLTCKLDRFNRRARSQCNAVLYASLVRDGDKYQKGDFGRFQGLPHIRDPAELVIWPIWSYDDSLQPRLSLSGLSTAYATSVDLVQLFRDRSAIDDFFFMTKEILVRAAADGHGHILELLLHYLARPRGRSLDHSLLRTAATGLQESTTRLLLQYGAQPNQGRDSLLCEVARADDPIRFHDGDDAAAQARIEIATLLLDHGADTKGALLAASKAGRTRLAQLLVARGATISRSSVRLALEKGRRQILDVVHEVGAVLSDCTNDSVDTSDASTTAVSGHQ